MSVDFNNQMRDYVLKNNLILFDVADIESHTDQASLVMTPGITSSIAAGGQMAQQSNARMNLMIVSKSGNLSGLHDPSQMDVT